MPVFEFWYTWCIPLWCTRQLLKQMQKCWAQFQLFWCVLWFSLLMICSHLTGIKTIKIKAKSHAWSIASAAAVMWCSHAVSFPTYKSVEHSRLTITVQYRLDRKNWSWSSCGDHQECCSSRWCRITKPLAEALAGSSLLSNGLWASSSAISYQLQMGQVTALPSFLSSGLF